MIMLLHRETPPPLTVQVLGSGEVDDAVHHLAGLLAQLPQVLAQRLVVQPLLGSEVRLLGGLWALRLV